MGKLRNRVALVVLVNVFGKLFKLVRGVAHIHFQINFFGNNENHPPQL